MKHLLKTEPISTSGFELRAFRGPPETPNIPELGVKEAKIDDTQ